ncbi:Golgin candidate 5 [Forsythia ovata]|uniref:Golgin candidate 5 n=1 Tax=Forsythia ovata TaxID=205694 RepID=A0ABD1X2G8_9LAMI
MAWFSGKVSLGNFPDFAGAVNKLSESVKNIEKNFDTALGLEEKSDATSSTAEGLWPSATDRKALFDPIIGFMGNKGEDSTVESLEQSSSSKPASPVKEEESSSSKPASPVKGEESSSSKPASPVKEKEVIDDDSSANITIEETPPADEANEETKKPDVLPEPAEESKDASEKQIDSAATEYSEADAYSLPVSVELSEQNAENIEQTESAKNFQEKISEEELPKTLELVEQDSINPMGQIEVTAASSSTNEVSDLPESTDEHKSQEDVKDISAAEDSNVLTDGQAERGEPTGSDSPTSDEVRIAKDYSESSLPAVQHEAANASVEVHENDAITKSVEVEQRSTIENEVQEQQRLSSGSNSSDVAESAVELEKIKKDMKMMEIALQGAARQAQAKADEIAKLMNENEQLKAVIEDLRRRKSNEAEVESLREEYHQRVATIERKVYALTKERDTLRREQNKKIDAAALLKEKDEIITQVMAEGEELSKKQAAQESQMRKLRAQIRELEEEKKGLLTKLQVEENKVESIKRDKGATEKLLQETIEKHQVELATQKEYYTNALNAAKEAEALAETRANTEARTEIESRLREAEVRESMLVQALEELRQTLSRQEQQAVFREDMLRRDIEDLQKRYQASERRCEELITQVPESTRPLLRQIEAMQETASRRAEAWAAVERSLNSRLQEAEAKAAAAEEKERSINERLSQTLSRINVLEAQISCLRAEQTQLTRSLEKERQKAAEHRQEYLALKEEADTHEGRVNQLEEEIRELRRKHKEELLEALSHQELLQQELEREKAARLDQERAARLQYSAMSDQSPISKQKSATFDNGNLTRKLSSASSLSSMEESYFLQTSLDSSDNLRERRNTSEGTMSPYYMKSMTTNTFEAALRQKEGELASYMSRLASMESIRDSLAEELVKMTAQCEKLQAESAMLPGIRAELEALRRRHSAALELMGERDEELEELRADIIDLKEMYREQVNLLVNKIQVLSSSIGAA